MFQRRFSNERITALLRDRALREEETAAHAAALEKKLAELSSKLQSTQTQLQQTTKDCILGESLHPSMHITPAQQQTAAKHRSAPFV